jgi:hypothetical protein
VLVCRIGIVDYFCNTFTAIAKASAVKEYAFAKASAYAAGCGAVGPVTQSVTRILEKSENQRFSIFRD